MYVSISEQPVFLEYSCFSSTTPNPKTTEVIDYTRAHLAEIAARHHVFQDLTTATSQALLEICIAFTSYKKRPYGTVSYSYSAQMVTFQES